MTREQTQIATRVSVVVAVVAAVVLLASLALPSPARAQASTTGLWILLSVPLSRNLAAAVVARGADRGWAVVGVVVSAAVVVGAVFY